MSLYSTALSRRFQVGVGALFAAVVLLSPFTLAAQGPPTPPPPVDPNSFLRAPTTHAGRFALRDDRALHAIQYLNCMNVASEVARQGKLGAIPDDAPLACVRDINGWRGVYGMVGSAGMSFRVLGQVAVNGTEGAPARTKVDTGAVLSTLRAMQRGMQSATVRNRSRYEFMAIPVVLETFTEVWVLPVQSSVSRLLVGGDSLIQLTADATREQGHFSSAPPVRELAAPSGNSYLILSNEEEIPLVSELVAARLALMNVPEVRIQTKKFNSVISNSTRRWIHTPRRG